MTHEAAEFSLRDAIEVLRLLDGEPNTGFDVRHGGLWVQCVRDPGTLQVGGDGKEATRQVLLKAPATGRLHGDSAVFAPGERPVHVKAGGVVGRIEAGASTTAVTSNVDGIVAHACVEADGFVEYGQVLLVIDVA